MKTEAKDLGMETCPGEEVMKEEKFSHNRKPSHRHVSGELCNLRGQHNWGKKRNTYTCIHTHTYTQNMCLMATAGREAAQMLTSASNERGLRREAQAASSSSVRRIRTGNERTEDN